MDIYTKKKKLFEAFVNSLSDNIIDISYLETYIDFCLKNCIGKKILKKTTSHHILPSAKTLPFKRYSDLDANDWNKAELTYCDHYYAHYLLMKAINHVSTYHAFACMHKKDFSIGRLNENDLISEEEFNEIWKTRNEKISEYRREKIIVDGEEITRAKLWVRNKEYTDEYLEKLSLRMTGKNNIVHKPGVLDKIRKKKSTTFIENKNMDTISAERAAETMKKEFIDENGKTTTIYKENGKKLSKNLKETDLGKRRADTKKRNYYSSPDCPRVIIYNVFDESYSEEMSLNAARK